MGYAPRSRQIRPQFFMNERLAECSLSARLLFIGLWTLADREGRLECRPKLIRAHIFPHESKPPDINKLLLELSQGEFISLYSENGIDYLWIRGWKEHQNCHHKELPSQLPKPPLVTIDDPSMIMHDSSMIVDDSSTKKEYKKEQEQEREKEEEKEEELFDQIITDLNMVTKRTGRQMLKVGEKVKTDIRARFKDGYTLEDFKHVHRVKTKDWVGTEYEKFLTPETLYRPTKFPKYAAQQFLTPKQTLLNESGLATAEAGRRVLEARRCQQQTKNKLLESSQE